MFLATKQVHRAYRYMNITVTESLFL